VSIENFYNPELMPVEELKATFVAREGLVDELVDLIKHQPKGAGTQHVVIIAPRGMGKTTVLLMLQLAIRERGLDRWVPVKFPEESYHITDLADFWIVVLEHTAAEVHDQDLLARTDRIKKEYRDSERLQQAALALIKDWSKKHGKRLVVMVENIDGIFEQIGDERANAALRDTLMNDGTVMLIGGATTYFEEARAHGQPLYNFFKIYNLGRLSFDQMQELLRKRASVDGVADFDQILEANRARVRALEYFTDGNPRLVLMLYRVIMQSELTEIHRGLEKLLDEVTPYYKAKVESLPVQQRKILDHIARLSSETGEGQTPAQIAEATRLPANQVSAQLKRLAELGYVRPANVRGRNSFYTLSDRLYAIWHQMRTGRDARQRMRWLVDFLRRFFEAQEIVAKLEELHERVWGLGRRGDKGQAMRLLEYMSYLADACAGVEVRAAAMRGVVQRGLQTDADRFVAELLPTIDLQSLGDGDAASCVVRASAQYASRGFDAALSSVEMALSLEPANAMSWYFRGKILAALGRDKDALASFERAAELENRFEHEIEKGKLLLFSGRFHEALASLERCIEMQPDSVEALLCRAVAHRKMGHQSESRLDLQDLLSVAASDRRAPWFATFLAYLVLNRDDEADEEWARLVVAANDARKEVAVTVLPQVARMRGLEFAKRLISTPGLRDHPSALPYTRAIDYLLTGDRTPVEKLSPEIRGIVEQIIASFEKQAVPKPQPLPKKPRTPRKRKIQQLS
jgi:tetratricopeptide (TPR) repeat protein